MVNEASPDLVVVDVNKRNVPVPRGLVDTSDATPDLWSVVRWEQSERGAQRASEANYGLTYLVCPRCRARVRPDSEEVTRMPCPDCGGEFGIDWENPC